MIICYILAVLVVTFGADLVWPSDAAKTCSGLVYSGTDDDVDIKIAAVLGIHESDSDKCSSIYNTGALQNAIALAWAVHLLNGNNETDSFIPGVRIGIEVYDDCNSKYLTARHAGTLAAFNRNDTGCSAGNETSSQEIPIAGVIGASISHTTTIMASVLESVYVPVIGPSATVPELSDKSKYPNFVRMVPSDLRQAEVIINLAEQFSWSYIVGISTSDNYGRDGMAELLKLAKERRICVILISDFDLFSESEMETFVRTTLAKILDNTKHNLGIVYFGQNRPLIRFLNFVDRRSSYWHKSETDRLKNIYWVASDAVEASPELAQEISQYNTNILIVSPFLVNLTSFKEYFMDIIKRPPAWIRGPWKTALSSVVTNNFRCFTYNFTEESLSGCIINDYLAFDSYIPSILDAVYLLANTLKAIQHKVCKGSPGPCDEFKSNLTNGLLKNYELLDLNYSTISPEYIPQEFSVSQRKVQKLTTDYEVYNQPLYSLQAISKNKFIKAAEFKDERILLSPGFSNIFSSSECKQICEECLYLEHLSYLFEPGDVIFLGIFSIMWQSDKVPYKCGLYRKKSMSYIALEAFINSIYYLRNTTGINFGYLILDDCYNVLTLTSILNRVLRGDITVTSINGSKTFNVSKVAVAIGAQSSPVTISALPILSELKIPMISYSSTNSNLDNRILFPYFSRTVNSDTMQARVFVDILKQMKVTFVGAIIIHNNYGLELYKIFRSFAESEGICVDDANEVTVRTIKETYESFLQYYRSKRIQVILIIAMDNLVNTLLTAVKLEDVFIFIGSESWGPNLDVISNNNAKKARGALVLGAPNIQLNNGLKEHLQTLDPFSNKSTVWLWDYWQDQFQCNLPGRFSNKFENRICDRSTIAMLHSMVDSLVNSPLAVHTTLATVSAGNAVSNLLTARKQMPFNPKEFTMGLHSVKLMSTVAEYQPFLESGNGNSGFEIYNVQANPNSRDKYIYVNVGNYRDNTGLSWNKELIKFYDAAGHITNKIESSCYFAGQQCRLVCDGSISASSPSKETTQASINMSGESDSKKTAVIILAIFLALSLLILIIIVIAVGYLTYTGKLKFKGKYASSGMPSDIGSSNLQDHSYSSPNASSSNVIPPHLPVRNTADHRTVYLGKATSDIVYPSSSFSTNIAARDRASSLPELSPNSIVKAKNKEQVNSQTLLSPEEHLSTMQVFQQSVPNKSETMKDGAQLSLSHEKLPIMLAPGTASHEQHAEGNEYSGLYRNSKNVINHCQAHPIEKIVFHNRPYYDSYTQSPLIDGNQHVFSTADHPEHVVIPMQKKNGVVYHLHNRDINILQNVSSPQFQASSQLIKPEQQAVQDISDQTCIGDMLLSGSRSKTNNETPIDYITPTDEHSSEFEQNLTTASLTTEINPQNHLDGDHTGAAVSQTGTYSYDGGHRFLPMCQDRIGSTYFIDPNNYIRPYHYGLTVLDRETLIPLVNFQDQILNPSKLGHIVTQFTNKQPNMSTMQQNNLELKHIVKPDSLPLPQAYFPRNQNLHLKCHPQDKGQIENVRNKSIIKEAQIDQRTISLPPAEEQVRHRTHYGQQKKALSLLEEEPEEML